MKIIICNYKFLSHGFFSALTLLLGVAFVPLSTRPVSKALCLQRGWGSGSARDARERHYGSRRHFPGITVTQQASTIQSENGSLAQILEGKAIRDIPLNGAHVAAKLISEQGLNGVSIFQEGFRWVSP